MRLISILVALTGMTACNFHGEVDPDSECSTSCEDDQNNCKDDCDISCKEDDDVATCTSTCGDDCDNTYDDCSLSCGENN